jgi:hypothetical protein
LLSATVGFAVINLNNLYNHLLKWNSWLFSHLINVFFFKLFCRTMVLILTWHKLVFVALWSLLDTMTMK